MTLGTGQKGVLLEGKLLLPDFRGPDDKDSECIKMRHIEASESERFLLSAVIDLVNFGV